VNYRTVTLTLFALAFLLIALLGAQTANGPTVPQASQINSATVHSTDTAVHHSRPAISADDSYKQNCTRCHSEVPPVSARRTKTIVRHMRVRANLPADEAEAILQYLIQ
jgi:hypothetical protein